MKKKVLLSMVATILLTTILGDVAHAENTNILANKIQGKFLLKANVGYVYNAGGTWKKSSNNIATDGSNRSFASSTIGYGGSFGYIHRSGWGLSADYLGFNHKWVGGGTGSDLAEYDYNANYHIITLTPSYKIQLDSNNNWGLQFGLGLGLSVSDLGWGTAPARQEVPWWQMARPIKTEMARGAQPVRGEM